MAQLAATGRVQRPGGAAAETGARVACGGIGSSVGRANSAEVSIGKLRPCIIGVWALPAGESGLLIGAILTRAAPIKTADAPAPVSARSAVELPSAFAFPSKRARGAGLTIVITGRVQAFNV